MRATRHPLKRFLRESTIGPRLPSPSITTRISLLEKSVSKSFLNVFPIAPSREGHWLTEGSVRCKGSRFEQQELWIDG